MANAAAEPRADGPTPDSGDDFEFCILSSGGIVPAGKGAGAGAGARARHGRGEGVGAGCGGEARAWVRARRRGGV